MKNDEMVKNLFKDIKKEIAEYVIEAGIINDEKNATKALYNEFGTEKIPERPFIRRGFDNIEKIVKNANTPSEVGNQMVKNMKKAILRSEYPRNAPSTIKKKGFDFPLVEYGDMYNSLTYRVGKNTLLIKSVE